METSKTIRISRNLLLAGAAFGALAAPNLAAAQSSASSAARTTPPYLDTIVVTGTRSERALRDNIGNISTLPPAELNFINAQHPSEALNRLSGVNVQRGSGVEHLTAVRSPVLTGGAGAGSFLYLEEGVPLRAAGFANVNGLFESIGEIGAGIEAIRGPGGALYGSNAVHGMINYLVRSPDTAPGSYIEGSYGSFDRYTLRGWTSNVLDDQGSGYMVGFSGLTDGGYRDNTGVDTQKIQARIDYNSGRVSTKTILSFVNLNQETGGYTPDYEGPVRRTNPDPQAYRDAEALRLSTRVDVDAGDGWTLSATPFFRTNDMQFRQHWFPSNSVETNGHWSVGAQLAAYKELPRGSLIFGTDLEYSDGYLTEVQTAPTIFSFTQGTHYDYDVTATVLAPYVHAEHALTDRVRVEAGLRLEATYYEYDTNIASGTFGRFFIPADRDDDYLTLTPNVGISYDLAPNTIAWARYTRGARAPQTTDAYRLQSGQTVGDIEEELIDSFETGVRGQTGPAQFELVGFYMEKQNFFFRDADGFNVIDGQTRHYGLEASASVQLTDQFEVRGSGTLASHTYQFDRPVSAPGESITDGDEIDTAPNLLLNAQLVWTPTDAITAEFAWTHVSEYFIDAENLNTYPGHDVFDLRLAWQLNDTLRAFGTVRNIFDDEYAERADFGFGSFRYFPGEPRAYTIGLGASF